MEKTKYAEELGREEIRARLDSKLQQLTRMTQALYGEEVLNVLSNALIAETLRVINEEKINETQTPVLEETQVSTDTGSGSQ